MYKNDGMYMYKNDGGWKGWVGGGRVDGWMGGWVGLRVGFIIINDMYWFMYNDDGGQGGARVCEAHANERLFTS